MPKRKKLQLTIQQQLIDAVNASALSQNELAAQAGIAQPHLNAFVNGKRGLSLESVKRLCDVLQLELVEKE